MTIKKHIPNTITCLNLFSGCVATVFAFHGDFFYSFLMIILAAVFDFFDGMVARLLHVSSPIGKELDSLADMVSFGFAPSTMVFVHLDSILTKSCDVLSQTCCTGAIVAYLLAVFSGVRLAKFNVDERQTTSFIGLPTPANALFFTSLLASPVKYEWWSAIVTNPYVMVALVLIFSYLLVAELPMFALKFKNLSWQDNKVRYVFLLLSLLLIVCLQFQAFPFIILLFILMSVVTSCMKK